MDNIDKADMERCYGEFYEVCETSKFENSEAQVLINRVLSIYADSKNPSVKSYCFLMLSAIFDGSSVFKDDIIKVVDFLNSELNALNNFAVKDANGQFIHFLNHAVYLCDSISSKPLFEGKLKTILMCSLLDTYLRADSPYGFNEDIVLAEFLLRANKTEFENIIEKLVPLFPTEGDDIFRFIVKEGNKRSLWMSMFGLNAHFKRQEQDVFGSLIAKVVGYHFPS